MTTCKSTQATGHKMIDDPRYPMPYRSLGGDERRHTVCTQCGMVSNRLADEEIVVTECEDHGVKTSNDYLTARTAVRFAREDAHEIGVFTRAGAPELHDEAYHDDGTNCWVCCDKMVIDPQGIFDH